MAILVFLKGTACQSWYNTRLALQAAVAQWVDDMKDQWIIAPNPSFLITRALAAGPQCRAASWLSLLWWPDDSVCPMTSPLDDQAHAIYTSVRTGLSARYPYFLHYRLINNKGVRFPPRGNRGALETVVASTPGIEAPHYRQPLERIAFHLPRVRSTMS